MTKQNISIKAPDRVNIIGVPISATNVDECVNFIYNNFERIRGNYICASNVHTTVMAHDNSSYKRVQTESIMSLPDGKPLSIIGRKKGKKNMDRVTGYNFMQNILSDSRFNGKRHYFYGTTEEVLELMIDNIKKYFPDLKICGFEPSIFKELTDTEIDELAGRVNRANADFLWIAIGAPRQEILMNKLKGKTNCIMTAVGGVFNILAGKVKNAPIWMQNLGLEWFYRLCKEPKRLFKRYFITNTKFVYYCLRNK